MPVHFNVGDKCFFHFFLHFSHFCYFSSKEFLSTLSTLNVILSRNKKIAKVVVQSKMHTLCIHNVFPGVTLTLKIGTQILRATCHPNMVIISVKLV